MDKYRIGTMIYLEDESKETVGIIIDKVKDKYMVKWNAPMFIPRVYSYTEEELDDNYPLV